MRAAFSFTRPSLSSLHHTLTRPISSLQNPTRPVSSNPPQTPLFLRHVTSSATASDLRRFRDWAHTLLNCHVESNSNKKDAIDPKLLARELNWLLEDAFGNRDLVLEFLDDDSLVPLRTDLDNLYTLWKQRVYQRRPFQYIVGCEHWRDLVLSVEEGVLIPRPETELVVDLVSDLINKDVGFFGEGLWADLGTGSGAIAIGIGKILVGNGRVFATDLSPVAVAIAGYNIQRYNLQDKIEVRMGSWFEPLKDIEGELVGLVSNPPYIPSAHVTGLQAEVAKHEPILALDGGANGMDDILHLCNRAASMLKPGGFFVFETNGETQCKFLVEHLENKFEGSFCDLKIVLDFAGIQRFVTGYRAS